MSADVDPRDDGAYRRGERTVGPETALSERLARIRAGLAEKAPDDGLSPDEILDGLIDEFEAQDEDDDVEEAAHDGDEGDDEAAHDGDDGDGRDGLAGEGRGLVVSSPAEALALWARWRGDRGRDRVRIMRPSMALLRPSAPHGSPVAFQAAALVESTPGFLLVERRLRAACGLGPAWDAPPAHLPGLPVPLRLLALPVFLAGLEARLPVELFPPEVVAGRDLLPGDRKPQEAIDAKYRDRYPATWRRGEGG